MWVLIMLSLNGDLFIWVILPLLICLARICDVTIGTIRIIFVSKGNKLLASVLGFFEVLIWLTAIGQIMKNLDNPVCYIAYAAGFAMGNYIGIMVEEKLAMGTLEVRICTNSDTVTLVQALCNAGFGITILKASGANGPVDVIYTVIKRNSLPKVDRIIKEFNPSTFYSIEEARAVHAGVFPKRSQRSRRKYLSTIWKVNHRK